MNIPPFFSLRFATLVGRQDFTKAIAYLDDKLQRDPSDVASLEMLAFCQMAMGQPHHAVEACRRILCVDPRSFPAHSLLATLLAEKGNHQEAYAHAKKGIDAFPESLPKLTGLPQSVAKLLGRVLKVSEPNEALTAVEKEQQEWLAWAVDYCRWHKANLGKPSKPAAH